MPRRDLSRDRDSSHCHRSALHGFGLTWAAPREGGGTFVPISGPTAARGTIVTKNQYLNASTWRRGRDSNPRYPCEYAAFRVRCFQPLSHLSAGPNGALTPSDGALFSQAGRPKQERCASFPPIADHSGAGQPQTCVDGGESRPVIAGTDSPLRALSGDRMPDRV